MNVVFQDKGKERISKLDTLRHSLAGMIRSPKSVLSSSSSVRDASYCHST